MYGVGTKKGMLGKLHLTPYSAFTQDCAEEPVGVHPGNCYPKYS